MPDCHGRAKTGLFLVAGDFRALLLGQADIVKPVYEAMLAKRAELELHLFPVWAGDRLGFEVDRHHRVGAFLGVFHQFVDDLLGQRDRQNAVLETVVIKNVGEARRDDAANAKIEQGPGRMLAARPAAEILRADQDLGVAVGAWFRTKSGFSEPSGLNRISWNSHFDSPVRLMVFR